MDFDEGRVSFGAAHKTWKQSGPVELGKRSFDAAYDPVAPIVRDGDTMFGEDGFSFADFIDIVNPLHHIPIIGSLYREATGDRISAGSRFIGGILFGGPSAVLTAALSSTDEPGNRGDIGASALATLFDTDLAGGNLPAIQQAASLPDRHGAAAETTETAMQSGPVRTVAATEPNPVQPLAGAVPLTTDGFGLFGGDPQSAQPPTDPGWTRLPTIPAEVMANSPPIDAVQPQPVQAQPIQAQPIQAQAAALGVPPLAGALPKAGAGVERPSFGSLTPNGTAASGALAALQPGAEALSASGSASGANIARDKLGRPVFAPPPKRNAGFRLMPGESLAEARRHAAKQQIRAAELSAKRAAEKPQARSLVDRNRVYGGGREVYASFMSNPDLSTANPSRNLERRASTADRAAADRQQRIDDALRKAAVESQAAHAAAIEADAKGGSTRPVGEPDFFARMMDNLKKFDTTGPAAGTTE